MECASYRGNRQEIRSKGTEADGPERQSDICRWRRLRNISYKTNGVEGPKVIVLEGFPEPSRGYCLAIVHISLGRIIPENAIDNNGNLSVGEPSIWSIPRFGLHRGCWHQEEGSNSDDKCNTTLHKEEPSPACPSGNAAEVEERKGEQGGDDCRHRQRCPELAGRISIIAIPN